MENGKKVVNNTNRKGTITKKRKKDSKINKMIMEYIKFYKDNLKRKTIILFILNLVLFFICFSVLMSNIDFNEMLKEVEIGNLGHNSIFSMLKEKLLIALLLIVSGITPYIYIPIIGIFSAYSYAASIVALFGLTNQAFNLIAMTIGAIIQLFGISITISQGIYYCGLSTKSFRYSQKSSFGITDVKKAIYEIKKDEKKVNEITKKQEERKQSIERLNVKIPYKMLVMSFVLSSIFIIIGTLIARI